MENTHPVLPVVAGVVIEKDNKYLLVQEKKKSAYGLWNFPSGRVNTGETLEETAVREAKEEVGYQVKLIKKIYVNPGSVDRPVKHIFVAEIVGGKLKFPKDEILDAKWFSFEEIKKMKDDLRGDWIIESIKRL